jgi:hypothetical protein
MDVFKEFHYRGYPIGRLCLMQVTDIFRRAGEMENLN